MVILESLLLRVLPLVPTEVVPAEMPSAMIWKIAAQEAGKGDLFGGGRV